MNRAGTRRIPIWQRADISDRQRTALRAACVRDLADAVRQQVAELKRRAMLAGKGKGTTRDSARSMKQRIDARQLRVRAAIHQLGIEAHWLIADPADLAATRASLAEIGRTFRRHAAAHHARLDLPSHRPDDKAFRAACKKVMGRYNVGPLEAAEIIVRDIARTLPEGIRAALLGPWRREAEAIRRLADRLRKPV